MPIAERQAHVVWKGTLRHGEGTLGATAGHDHSMVRGALRFQQEHGVPLRGTNPEELMAAAGAVCLAQTLAYRLTEGGVDADWFDVFSFCTLDLVEAKSRSEESAFRRTFGETPVENFTITKLHFKVSASIPKSHAEAFEQAVAVALELSPVANALEGNVEVTAETQYAANVPEPPA